MKIRIHRILKGSRANGPGRRNVVWFQGCSLQCPGCFNPLTHDISGGKWISVKTLSSRLLEETNYPDGITISGGEPFQQTDGLYALLKSLSERNSPPILVFSGYSYEELRLNPEASACLPFIDALICGRYQKDLAPAYERFCSSSNQQLVLLSSRLKEKDFEHLPLNEIMIDETGVAIQSGILS